MAVLNRRKAKEIYGRLYWDFFDLDDYIGRIEIYHQHDQEMLDVYYGLTQEKINNIISLLNKFY